MILFDGHPADVRGVVNAGFDLVIAKMPLYCAERGVAVTFGFGVWDGGEIGIGLRDVEYRNDHRAILEDCDCKCCKGYRRSYIHHLLVVHELMGRALLVQHNVRHYQRFLEVLRTEAQEPQSSLS
jgi:tRNA-guanine family transglycosylase